VIDAERVIAAADELFEEHGFHATSVEQVAITAGYSKGTVYEHFGSKDDLFFAVCDRRVALTVAEMKSALASDDGGPDAVAKLGVADDRWLAVFVEFWAHVLREPQLRARFAELYLRTLEPLVTALESRGVDDPRRLAAAMYAEELGLSLERLLFEDGE
jgi:AcrR family transcriptional regulator